MLLAGVLDQWWGNGDGLPAEGTAGSQRVGDSSYFGCPPHAARLWAGARCGWKHGPKHVCPGLWQRVWGGWPSRGGPRRCRGVEGLEEKPRDESVPAQCRLPVPAVAGERQMGRTAAAPLRNLWPRRLWAASPPAYTVPGAQTCTEPLPAPASMALRAHGPAWDGGRRRRRKKGGRRAVGRWRRGRLAPTFPCAMAGVS